MENARIRMFLKTIAHESSTLRLLRDDPERIKQRFSLSDGELEALRSADLLHAGELAGDGGNPGRRARSAMPGREALEALDASGTGTIVPPTTRPPATTKPPSTIKPPCEPSGSVWVARFPTSMSIADLAPTFRPGVDRFIAALRAAGAQVVVSATISPPERAYLRYYSCQIARAGLDPSTVPPMVAVNICWLHTDAQGKADVVGSKAAAEQMVVGYGIGNPPALFSRYTQRRAIDMTVTWQGMLVIADETGQQVTITSTSTNGAGNSDLWKVGASYGVIKLVTDPLHWSDDGQ